MANVNRYEFHDGTVDACKRCAECNGFNQEHIIHAAWECEICDLA